MGELCGEGLEALVVARVVVGARLLEEGDGVGGEVEWLEWRRVKQ